MMNIHPLDSLMIELPSWGFADTGTRFGKYPQAAAAATIEEKLADAALIHRLTGCCPKVAVHVQWDFKPRQSPKVVADLALSQGIQIGSINPNLFQDFIYKFGSFCSPNPEARKAALNHCRKSIKIMKEVGSKTLTLWLADGINYPGQDDLIARKHRLKDGLRRVHDALVEASADAILLIEYKPFEPAFYATDLADWGMSLLHCLHAGKNAKVLIDTGHHYPTQNIEQIVAFLLDERMLGGFHFNDRRYADDDLTLGSIDPYQVFRIFHELQNDAYRNQGKVQEIAFTVDQSHNLKPKLEAMIQTVDAAQRLWLKASKVDRSALAKAQLTMNIVDAETILKRAFDTDVTQELLIWRKARNLPEDPIQVLRQSGEVEKREKERGIRVGNSYA